MMEVFLQSFSHDNDSFSCLQVWSGLFHKSLSNFRVSYVNDIDVSQGTVLRIVRYSRGRKPTMNTDRNVLSKITLMEYPCDSVLGRNVSGMNVLG